MSLTAPTQGDREILKRLITWRVLGDSLILRLFKNKTGAGVLKGDSVRSYLLSNGTGYAQQTLLAANWTWAPGATGDSIFYPQATFTYTGADSVNGYYVNTMKLPGDSIVVWAEVFSNGPYVIPAGGGTIKVTLQLGMN